MENSNEKFRNEQKISKEVEDQIEKKRIEELTKSFKRAHSIIKPKQKYVRGDR